MVTISGQQQCQAAQPASLGRVERLELGVPVAQPHAHPDTPLGPEVARRENGRLRLQGQDCGVLQ